MTLSRAGVVSSRDGSEQPVVIGVPEGVGSAAPTPLLVGLHTWSADYRQQALAYGTHAAQRGWLLVLPDFRGPNKASNPNGPRYAGGSLYAQSDVVDARAWMIERYNVDTGRVYLTGDSGGGHMTLLMAGKHPDLWAAAAAWVPVSDLRDWWSAGNAYAKDVVAVTGGEPGASPEVDFEYARRSPRTFMTNLAHLPVLLGHGDCDPTIPVEQSWQTFRMLGNLPAHNTLLHVFSGGHEGLQTFGLDWCVEQTGSSAPARELHLVTDESKSYYYACLQVADGGRLATADVIPADDAISIATANLVGLTLDLSEQPLAAGPLAIAVRNDVAMVLTLRGIAPQRRVECDGAWASPTGESDGSVTVMIQPGAEARSFMLR